MVKYMLNMLLRILCIKEINLLKVGYFKLKLMNFYKAFFLMFDIKMHSLKFYFIKFI